MLFLQNRKKEGKMKRKMNHAFKTCMLMNPISTAVWGLSDKTCSVFSKLLMGYVTVDQEAPAAVFTVYHHQQQRCIFLILGCSEEKAVGGTMRSTTCGFVWGVLLEFTSMPDWKLRFQKGCCCCVLSVSPLEHTT